MAALEDVQRRLDVAQRKLVLAVQHGRERPRGGAPDLRLRTLLDVGRQGVERRLRLVEAALEQPDVSDVRSVLQRRLADFGAEVDDLVGWRGAGQHISEAGAAGVAQVGWRQGRDRFFRERLREHGEIPRTEAVALADLLEAFHVAGPQVAAHQHDGSGVVPIVRRQAGIRVVARLFLLAPLQPLHRAQDRRQHALLARPTQQPQGGIGANRHIAVVAAFGHAGAFEGGDFGVQRGAARRIERFQVRILEQRTQARQGELPWRKQGADLRQRPAAGRQRRQALGRRRLVSAGHGNNDRLRLMRPALLPHGRVWQPISDGRRAGSRGPPGWRTRRRTPCTLVRIAGRFALCSESSRPDAGRPTRHTPGR